MQRVVDRDAFGRATDARLTSSRYGVWTKRLARPTLPLRHFRVGSWRATAQTSQRAHQVFRL